MTPLVTRMTGVSPYWESIMADDACRDTYAGYRPRSSCLAVQHMLGCCRTAVVPDWCGRFSAHGRSGRNVPWFCGSLSGIRGFGGVLPSAVSGAIFTNRGFPTFPWGQYPRGRRIPVNSHAGYGRTGTNRGIPTVLPHHPHATARIPASLASIDTDGDPSVGRRLHRH